MIRGLEDKNRFKEVPVEGTCILDGVRAFLCQRYLLIIRLDRQGR